MTNTSPSFIFVGDTNVGARISNNLVEAGYLAAPDVAWADVVFTYVGSTSTLEETYLGEEGLLKETHEGAILVDLSATAPSFARDVFGVTEVGNRFFADAPLVVRNMAVEDAFAHRENLAMVVGAEAEVQKKILPMLEAIAGNVMWVGNPGAGQTAKAALTLKNAAALVGVIEAKAALDAAEAQVNPEDLLEFMEEAGLATESQISFIEAVIEGEFEGTFTVEHLMGELSAALTAADERDLILPQAESGFRLMELLAMVGGVEMTPAALTLVFASEEDAKKNGLDWSRAEGAFEEHDHECECGHDHGEDHECCGKHHHHHDEDYDEDDYNTYESAFDFEDFEEDEDEDK